MERLQCLGCHHGGHRIRLSPALQGRSSLPGPLGIQPVLPAPELHLRRALSLAAVAGAGLWPEAACPSQHSLEVQVHVLPWHVSRVTVLRTARRVRAALRLRGSDRRLRAGPWSQLPVLRPGSAM